MRQFHMRQLHMRPGWCSIRIYAAVLAALLTGLFGAAEGYSQSKAGSARPIAQSRATSPANRYVDPARCAECHTEIARSFQKTGMARSFYRMSAQKAVEDFQSGKPFYHEPSDSYFTMVKRGDNFYQRRWQ